MERKSGMAAIAVLVAVLGFSFMPRRGGDSAGSAEPARHARTVQPTRAAKPAESKLRPACDEISDRVSRFFTGSEIHHPSSCYQDEKDDGEPIANQTTKFAIALVPNPAQTNLPVVFDRLIEAIQQAAQDENYSYDGSWFPWTEEKDYGRFGDEEKAEALQSELQQQPGVVAFRRNGPGAGAIDKAGPYDGGLLVFVVGEQPTGGIDDEQFENALEWLKKLGADASTNGVRILGPTFSGSLPSLQRELTNSGLAPNHLDNVKVYSGTANSNEIIHAFQQFICKAEPSDSQASQDPNASQGCRRFRTFLESDKLMTHRFLQFVRQGGYCLERVAILSEDETAFGAESAPSTHAAVLNKDRKTCQAREKEVPAAELEGLPTYLYYPRDIATLRSAYSKQSIFSQSKQPNNAPSSTLRGDLGEAATSTHDTVQSYGGNLTPYVQESTLFGIVNVLQAKHIQFVLIRSSNSLDQLFLSEFLRRSYPGGRVVLDGADLLFRRGMEGESLRGVMLLSTYPLLAWTQDQIRPMEFQSGTDKDDGDQGEKKGESDQSGHHKNDKFNLAPGAPTKSYRIFGDELSEGEYIAARGLFNTGTEGARTISDYGVPPTGSHPVSNSADDLRPATWLTVVGHRQFWPIAVLNDNTLKLDSKSDPTEEKAALLLPAEAGAATTRGPSNGAQPGPPFPADTTALVLFCCALAFAHLLLCWKGSMIGSPRMRAYFAPIPLAQQPALIFIGGLLLAALAVTFGGATGLFESFYTGRQFYLLFLAVEFLVLCGLGGFIANYNLPMLAHNKATKEQVSTSQQEVAHGAAAGAGHSHADVVVTILPCDEALSKKEAESDAVAGSAGASHEVGERPQPAGAKSARSTVHHEWDSLLNRLWKVRDLLVSRDIPLSRLAVLWLACLAVLIAIRCYLNLRFTDATRLSAFWRNSHISNGVSGLLPQVLLILGFYAWFWYNLRGLSLFGEDRPVLPRLDSLPECFHSSEKTVAFESQDDRHDRAVPRDPRGARLFAMFSAEQAGAFIEEAAHPLGWFYLKSFGVLLIVTAGLCFLALGEQSVQTLGERTFGHLIFLGMSVAIALVLADTLQFARTWGRLRQLLVLLDRLRLRRTLACLKGLSWKSVLSMSSNVLEERYSLISRQLESARNLQTTLGDWKPEDPVNLEHKTIANTELAKCEAAGRKFAEKYTLALSDSSSHNVRELKRELMAYQQEVAKTAGRVLTHILLPSWQRERQSLILETEAAGKADDDKVKTKTQVASADHVRAAEEFFVLPYLGFIQNILGRVRTIAVAILLLFTATTLALSSYPFSPTPALGAIFLVLFIVVGAAVVFVYAEMHRDATLSHITQSPPGELGFEFWSRIFSFGIGPLIGLLTTLFPSFTDFVVSWLQPGAETMK